MEEENKEVKQDVILKAKEEVEKLIKIATENGLQASNVQLLYQLIDIHKDIENEKYWENKEEAMRYMRDDYGMEDYRGGRSRDSQGRFMGDRRMTSYRGQRVLDEMYNGYRNYNDGKEEYNRGNYGAKGETMKSLEYMLESVTDFIEMLQNDASSQEEVDMIKHYTRKISEM
ncbi:MAG: hypothetical protein ACLS59_06790 [Clostridia bacterium]